MKHLSKHFAVTVVMVALMGCGDGGRTTKTTAALQTAGEAATLAFVNDPLTTFEVLDVDCGLRSDTAKKILRHRDGPDKVWGTADDNPFDDLAELDGVTLVGPWSLEQLRLCADSHGYTPTPYELAVINFVNDAFTDFNRLDIDCGLRSDAAANLIAAKSAAPFHSLAEIDAVSQVGPVTLDLLGQCASAFGFDATDPDPDPQQCVPASWDGTFDAEDYYWDVSQLSGELAAVIPALQANAEENRDTSVYFPVRFGEVLVHSLAGQVVHYEVSFVQMIDLEGGIQLWFRYELDSCLNQTGFWMGI